MSTDQEGLEAADTTLEMVCMSAKVTLLGQGINLGETPSHTIGANVLHHRCPQVAEPLVALSGRGTACVHTCRAAARSTPVAHLRNVELRSGARATRRLGITWSYLIKVTLHPIDNLVIQPLVRRPFRLCLRVVCWQRNSNTMNMGRAKQAIWL